MKKFLIGLGIVLASLVIIGGALVGGIAWYVNSELQYVEITPEEIGIREDHPFLEQGVVNIALFGVDARTPGEPARSDSMMIATLNPQTKKVYLTSLMRDMLVPIDGYGNDKLNHAYAYGGATKAIQTLNHALDLNIQYYASVDFTSLQQVVDGLGGVNIDVDSEELPHLAGVGVSTTGIQHLNGEQALAYSRIRYASGGDYRRTERQQEVITSLATSLSSHGISGALTAMSTVLPYVETNIDLGKMMSLGTTALQIGTNSIVQQRFPQDGMFTSGIDASTGLWVINVDLEEMKTSLHQTLTQ